MPADHAPDRRPPLRAGPIRPRAARSIGNGGRGGAWSAVITVLVFIAGEDIRRTVRVCEHKRIGQQIRVLVTVCQRHAVAFRIPIGDEYRRLVARHEIAGDVLDRLGAPDKRIGEEGLELVSVLEFRHLPGTRVVLRLDRRRLVHVADDLLHPPDIVQGASGFLRYELFDGEDIRVGDVFDGIDAETCNPIRDKFGEIRGECVSYMG